MSRSVFHCNVKVILQLTPAGKFDMKKINMKATMLHCRSVKINRENVSTCVLLHYQGFHKLLAIAKFVKM